MLTLVVLSFFISGCLSATTHMHHTTHPHHTHAHHTGPTHEPDVHHGITFHYDHQTHRLIVREGRHCYLYHTTAQEQMDIHTAQGLTSIEMKVLGKIALGGNTMVVPHDDPIMKNTFLHKYCPTSRYTIHKFT